MSKGKVIESGRHVDLMSKDGGAYATLMRLQQSLPEPDSSEMRNQQLDTATTLYMGQANGADFADMQEGFQAESQLDTSSTISYDDNKSMDTSIFGTQAGLLGTVSHSKLRSTRGGQAFPKKEAQIHI